MTFVDQPICNDVLCGRGGKINHHEGNIQFRAFVDMRKERYTKAKTKSEKALISREIIDCIASLDPPGRFLNKDKESGAWYVEKKDNALKKTSQALRETGTKMRNMKSFDTASTSSLATILSDSSGLINYRSYTNEEFVPRMLQYPSSYSDNMAYKDHVDREISTALTPRMPNITGNRMTNVFDSALVGNYAPDNGQFRFQGGMFSRDDGNFYSKDNNNNNNNNDSYELPLLERLHPIRRLSGIDRISNQNRFGADYIFDDPVE